MSYSAEIALILVCGAVLLMVGVLILGEGQGQGWRGRIKEALGWGVAFLLAYTTEFFVIFS